MAAGLLLDQAEVSLVARYVVPTSRVGTIRRLSQSAVESDILGPHVVLLEGDDLMLPTAYFTRELARVCGADIFRSERLALTTDDLDGLGPYGASFDGPTAAHWQ